MGELDRIPENAFSAELKRRATEADELKGSFQSLGATSVITHRVFSPSVYDVQMTASATPGMLRVHRVDVEFIPDDLTFGGAFCHRVYARVLDTLNAPVTFTNPMSERQATTDGKQKWSFFHVTFGYPSDTIRLKFYFFTTGSGTFTTTIVS